MFFFYLYLYSLSVIILITTYTTITNLLPFSDNATVKQVNDEWNVVHRTLPLGMNIVYSQAGRVASMGKVSVFNST